MVQIVIIGDNKYTSLISFELSGLTRRHSVPRYHGQVI